MNRKLTVVFDVDGTLIHQVGEKEDTPRYDIIQAFHHYERLGFNMLIWSGGGVDYAERWRDRLGLDALVVEKKLYFEHKPHITYDDMGVELGVVNIKV